MPGSKANPIADWLVTEWRCKTIDVRVISFHPVLSTSPFSDQLWTICMEFGKSATNFNSPPIRIMPERPPKRCTAEIACTISELHAMPPKLAEKGVVFFSFLLLDYVICVL